MPRPNFNKPTHSSPGNNPSTPIYSDASSSYWPPGWNYAKFSTATAQDRASLPEGELEKMQAGLRDVLGESGVGALAMHLFREEQKRAKETKSSSSSEVAPPKPALSPDWLRNWRRRHRGQEWGFVVFRATLYGDEEEWEGYKKRVEGIVRGAFEREGEGVEDWEEARGLFELRWVEGGELDGAGPEVLRGRYEGLKKDLSAGLAHGIFLCASEDAVKSVIGLDKAELPTIQSMRWRPTAPFLLAVSADADPGLEEGHEERDWFKPAFKVAAETIVDELWPLIDSDMMPLRRITRHVKAWNELGGQQTADNEALEDIWWTMAPSPERLKKRRRDVE
ncbi:hypothetical protein OQA88_9421 [Cercophora sp. LCS_1]